MDNIVIKKATLEDLADIQFLNNELFMLEKVTASAKNKVAIEFYYRIGFEDFNLTLTMEEKK